MFIPLIISFRDICVVTAALPLVTLTICFVSAYIFQAEEIHETHCKVYNVIPSISAITGVSPQRYGLCKETRVHTYLRFNTIIMSHSLRRYLWRLCMALHIGPRFAIAGVYRNYYRSLNAQFIPAGEQKAVASLLIKVVFALNIIEILSLSCVTYVSNRENYRKYFLLI